VVASLSEGAVDGLDDATSVPTTGPITGFNGGVTPQLSIWRRLHVETDVMAATNGDKIDAVVCPAGRVNIFPGITVSRLTTDKSAKANEYERGFVKRISDGSIFPVLQNSGGGNFSVDVLGDFGNAKDVPVTIYQDDWRLENGNLVPQVNAANFGVASALYDYMRTTTVRLSNWFGDAYIEPTYDLDTINSKPTVTSIPHFGESLDASGTKLGFPEVRKFVDSSAYESPVHWVVYVSSSYEAASDSDYDPAEEGGESGVTLWTKNIGDDMSVIHVEESRDFAQVWGYSFSHVLAATTAHEVAHQFGLARGNGAVDGHWKRGAAGAETIMGDASWSTPAADLLFARHDIRNMRLQMRSPSQ
jgi:hypothetical protein